VLELVTVFGNAVLQMSKLGNLKIKEFGNAVLQMSKLGNLKIKDNR